MVFSDLFFLFVFLPAFMLIYMLAHAADTARSKHLGRPSFSLRNAALVIFSLLFYSWGEPVYVFLMIILVAVNYLTGLWMCRTHSGRRIPLIIGLICNIAAIFSFKYLGFFARILSSIGVPCEDPQIALPIGISFYVFQSISYLVDVYRNDSPAQRRYSDLLLYISMFPQLIAGPIVRYGTVAEEINSRHVSAADIADGVFRFMIGLGKKVIIANQLAAIADQFLAGEGLKDLSTGGAWIGIIAFSLQIYFDFSGYSDMAIGIGRCIGFHFCENFNHPYVSKSMTEFWRRWHMSLGSFFRDYVYIPLGGNRRHQWLNILIVWALTGLWHGASWNFVIWGLFFAFFITLEKFTILKWKKIPAILLHIYALFVIIVGWGLFYFDDLQSIKLFYHAAFGGNTSWDFTVESAIFDNFWLWITAILFCLPVRSYVNKTCGRLLCEGSTAHRNLTLSARVLIAVAILILSVTLLVGATNNPFLYTRF
ncbi:MAG: MBOAT family protein [Clostridium sp.]|nr:MBOAT family protein [Prevotella sp.]MCM1429020.1 MBOAT family protein [Clostridium sp.]MCM1475449.1 MBOAT family protein [Muribaculaceae bacterium]